MKALFLPVGSVKKEVGMFILEEDDSIIIFNIEKEIPTLEQLQKILG